MLPSAGRNAASKSDLHPYLAKFEVLTSPPPLRREHIEGFKPLIAAKIFNLGGLHFSLGTWLMAYSSRAIFRRDASRG